MRKTFLFALVVILLLLPSGWGAAQGESDLVVRLTRNFGYSSGMGKVQGTFTVKASGPQDLSRVTFYLDGEQMGELTQEPFHLRFSTDRYDLGGHTLYAIGVTAGGHELHSNEINLQFVSAEEGWQSAMRFIFPLLALVFGLMIFSYVVMFLTAGKTKNLPLGTPRNYGLAGGAICPRCQRPFPRHVLAPNLVAGKLERCPFCGRWSVVRARSLDELRVAEAAELETDQDALQPLALSEDERLRRDLEASRYHDL
jgi:hypothetical protein